jgi:3-oxoacyl-[acyl-carrier-protein] synthase-3
VLEPDAAAAVEVVPAPAAPASPASETAPAAAPASFAPSRQGAAVLAVGSSLPDTVVTNDEVAARIGKTDEWIYTRTGIRARRRAQPGERLVDCAAAASRVALGRAGLDAAELDLVVLGTMTPDEPMPTTAVTLADALGAVRAGALEVNAACTGFLSALSIGAGQIESGRAQRALVVGADFISRVTDHDSKATAMLFADGAGAVVLGATPPQAGRIGPLLLRSEAAPEVLSLGPEAGATIEMDGHETFKQAVSRMAEVTREAVAAAGLTLAEIDLFVYHQANGRIVKAVGERLGLDEARVVDCIEQTGNMSAATVPYALEVAERDGRLHDGARVLLSAFGGGFTWGGGVIEWGRGDG